MTDRPHAGTNGSRGRWWASSRDTQWWAWAAALGTLAGVWAFSSPIFSVPDEPSHVIKAAAVARGQLLGDEVKVHNGSVTEVQVPAVYAVSHRVPECYARQSNVTADCAPAFSGSTRSATVRTTAGRNPPFYYFIVGLPSLVFTSVEGIYLMRLVSAAMCAAFLASAFASARLFARARVMIMALGLALTPMVLFLAGAVNPNGVEIAAAICLWASLAALLLVPGHEHNGRLVARVGLAACAMVLTRALAPGWLLLIAALFLPLVGWGRMRDVLSSRMVRVWVGVVGLAAVFTVAWVVGTGTLSGSVEDFADYSTTNILRESFGKTYIDVLQMIGSFGWLDTPAPAFTYLVWLFGVGFLLLLAWGVAVRRQVVALVAVLAVVVLVPFAMEASQVRHLGFAWQGRYTLPLAVGLPVLAAVVLLQAPVAVGSALNRAARAVFLLAGSGHLAAYAWATRRYTVGTKGRLNYLQDQQWSPPLPALLLLVAYGLGLAAIVVLMQRSRIAGGRLAVDTSAITVAAAPVEVHPTA